MSALSKYIYLDFVNLYNLHYPSARNDFSWVKWIVSYLCGGKKYWSDVFSWMNDIRIQQGQQWDVFGAELNPDWHPPTSQSGLSSDPVNRSASPTPRTPLCSSQSASVMQCAGSSVWAKFPAQVPEQLYELATCFFYSFANTIILCAWYICA